MRKQIRIIGVPLDLGAGRRGVDMGPSALRVADIEGNLERLKYEVEDYGDLPVTVPETVAFGRTNLRFAEAVLAVNQRLVDVVEQTLAEGRMPLVLGGDHSLAIGSVSGTSRFFARSNQRVGLVWLDAHGDINTPQTTPSGNIHGMCLAALLGMGDERLTQVGGPGPKVDGRNVAVVGVRDLDPGEREHLRQVDAAVFTIRDVDERGMAAVMTDAIAIATRGTAGIHLQLDMDVLDPEVAPGTGTPVQGGLTYREAHLAMEMLADSDKLIAIDVVEINPILGSRNRTAELAVGLVCSALGKRIF